MWTQLLIYAPIQMMIYLISVNKGALYTINPPYPSMLPVLLEMAGFHGMLIGAVC